MKKIDFRQDKENRLCPSFIGAVIHTRNTLRVATATSEISIKAPARFLKVALQLCDGTKTVQEIIAQLPSSIDQTAFRRFIGFLIDAGAVIDGNLLTSHALQYGHQASPYGASAPAHITRTISERFSSSPQYVHSHKEIVQDAPLNNLFRDRISCYTFDDTDLSIQHLTALLWSLCGIVAPAHERLGKRIARRTIASAGALHLLQVYLALQRPVGNYQAGIYRVHYPDAKSIAFEYLGAYQDRVPRAFAQPWHTQFSSGVIFLAADIELASMRYRNRALQYLFMEAGAALHNGALTAPKLGLGFAPLGCYYETIVQQLCQLEGEIVLGSAVFGPKPTRRQLAQLRGTLSLEFAWADTHSVSYSLPTFLARATDKQNSNVTWGIDATPWMAYRKACAESVERRGLNEPKDLRKGCLSELRNAVPPDQFIRYHRQQYSRVAFPFQRFSADQAYWWKKGIEYGTGRKVWIHADLIYPRSALTASYDVAHTPITYATTSGCAAGTSQDEAFERALFELVERDAFMRCWLSQMPGQPIAPRSIPMAIRARLDALRSAHCKVGVQLLPSPWARVVMVWAQHESLHFTSLGTAAHDDVETALVAALSELESRVFVWLNGHRPDTTIKPSSVRHTAHHFNLYGCVKYFSKADRILRPTSKAINFTELANLPQLPLCTLSDRFARHEVFPIHIDITPENSFIDQGRTKLQVVRAFVPSLIPISFGYQLEPQGMVDAFHPDSRFPHPFP